MPWLVYDSGQRRFFAIRPEQRTVTKGPQLPAGDAHRPVQIGALSKNPLALRLGTSPGPQPQGAATDASPPDAGTRRLTAVARGFFSHPTYGVLALDASGRIQLLDVATLQFVREVARLPKPAALFAPQAAVTPRDVAAYAVEPVAAFWRDGAQGEWFYTGCAVATLSADATAVRVEMFDPNGRTLASGETEFVPYVQADERRSGPADTVRRAYFGVPGAAPVTGLKFALECLHPPVLLLLSYFTAPRFEATAGYRSLLLLPNSFVAMKARDSRAGPMKRSADAGMLMLPSVILATLFAGLVARDGAGAGLTKNARTKWFIATLVFGLPAYITYRLTRPTIRMVTCRNCGQMRRPDQEACHGCGSAWVVPELTPPAWRVLDNGAEMEERTSSAAEPANSSAL
jgi:hypothetical protein